MSLNRGQKLFIPFAVFLVVTGGICFLHYSNRPRGLNVILITIDTLRADRLSCYGYKKDTSPNIDKLAKEGILFTQAISQSSSTPASMASILTSTYLSTHKVHEWNRILSPKLLTISEILKNHGYYTSLCNGHDNRLFEIIGFQRGFDVWTDDEGLRAADIVNEEALDFLVKAKNKKRKFFLWIHYIDVHGYSRGAPDMLTDEEINIYKLKYDEAIMYVDSKIADLLKRLKELGFHRNTLIILTADHGEELDGHNNYLHHGNALWDSLIKVPLIIHCPNLLPKNKIITQQFQHIDIAPTICDILKIKKPKTFEGKSLLLLVKGRNIFSLFAFSEEQDSNGGSWSYSKFSIRTSEHKLIYTYWSDGREEYELYNIKADPEELNDIVDIEKEQSEFLEAKLKKWMSRPRPNITSLSMPLDEETKERLRSLGYLQ